MESQPIVLERQFAASPAKVWKALTDKTEMKFWYFDLAEFKAEVGFTFEFFGGPPEKSYRHVCEVTEVIPQKKLTYSWRYDGYPGISHVTFELFEKGKQTLLRLTHTGIETFPPEADFARKNFEGGWDHIINTSMREYLGEEK